MSTDQIVPYWDSVNAQFQGPANVPNGSVETYAISQATGASATIPLGITSRAGIVKDVRVAAITPLTTNDTYTVDIRKNGVTILTAPMALLAGTAARASIVGVLAVANTPLAVGDFLEAVIVYTHGTGTAPLNVIAQLQAILN